MLQFLTNQTRTSQNGNKPLLSHSGLKATFWWLNFPGLTADFQTLTPRLRNS
jgi:hypothetical protein